MAYPPTREHARPAGRQPEHDLSGHHLDRRAVHHATGGESQSCKRPAPVARQAARSRRGETSTSAWPLSTLISLSEPLPFLDEYGHNTAVAVIDGPLQPTGHPPQWTYRDADPTGRRLSHHPRRR
ncbi:hypothetical protein KUTG_10008 [Kutzneria sp. 744]|nr:hypothetical protein KUTG_10008 [Kutzneria sp. 744]